MIFDEGVLFLVFGVVASLSTVILKLAQILP
jgi:hypothetical protein